MMISAARYGLPGLLAAPAGMAALLVLTGRVLHLSIAWPALIDLGIILAAASAIGGGLVISLREEGKDRERERALRQRLQEDERRWKEDRAGLLRLQSGLTEREWELLPLLARDDLTYEQIADHLVVSVDTIKTHVHRLGRKWGSAGRRAIVAAARERGLLPPAGPDAAPPSG
jgi:DNA-binding CsgD family transcriptional regulator